MVRPDIKLQIFAKNGHRGQKFRIFEKKMIMTSSKHHKERFLNWFSTFYRHSIL